MAPDKVREDSGWPGIPAYQEHHLTKRASADFLVIPVINEGSRISDQLAAIQRMQLPLHVVLADGGSTDGSTNPKRLCELGVDTLLVKRGPGKLSAQLRMGFDYALRSGATSIVTIDGNGKDGVEAIPEMFQAMNTGLDFVQGSRFVSGGVAENTPLSRYLAIRLGHAPMTSLAARRLFTDTTNGFRGHSRRLLTDHRLAPFRDVFRAYELLAYLPIGASRLGWSTAELPVARRYPPTGETPTKIGGARGNAELARTLIKAATGGFAPTSVEVSAARRLVEERYGASN